MKNLNSPLYYKTKTTASLNALLLATPELKTNWKLIPSIQKLLNTILGYNIKDNGASSITFNRFRYFLRDDYSRIRDTLETLGLLTIKREAHLQTAFRRGKCWSYQLTPKCHALLNDANWEYLYKIMTDPQEIRRKQKRISKRTRTQPQSIGIKKYIKASNDNCEFDYEETHRICQQMSAEKSANVGRLLIMIVNKDYGSLANNKADNRIWHPFAQLPAEIRAVLRVNGRRYLESLDIRSCYPSLWAEYIYNQSASKATLEAERIKYRKLFLTPDLDPKAYLSAKLNIPRNLIKEILIRYYNGKRVPSRADNAYFKFNQYLKTEFPLLYAQWQQTDIRQTGNNIGKQFETKLMLDNRIYKYAESLGYTCGYEYDGLSIYGDDPARLGLLYDYIEKLSVELLGIELVLVKKDNRELLQTLLAKSQMENLWEQYEFNENKLHQMRRSNFATKDNTRWPEYYLLRNKNQSLLEAIRPLAAAVG